MLFRNLSLGFAAGGVGAIANVAFVAIAAATGLIAAMGISMAPPPMPAFLYKQIVWGGIFGMAFAFPAISRSWIRGGLLVGLAASLVALFIVFPSVTVDGRGPGMAGLNAGQLMPVLVLVANSIWGLAAAWWYRRMTA